jgi:hypothetical protein
VNKQETADKSYFNVQQQQKIARRTTGAKGAKNQKSKNQNQINLS